MTAGEGPSARFSMAGDSLDPQRGGVIVFIGGCNKTLEALDDMYFLYTGSVFSCTFSPFRESSDVNYFWKVM